MMTVIAGVVHEKGVLLGGDSVSMEPDLQLTERLDRKVIRNGSFVIGASGRFRIPQVLEYDVRFTRPEGEEGNDFQGWMVRRFVPEAQQAFKAADWLPKTGELLVAHRDRLAHIFLEDWQVVFPSRGYDAIGSGGSLALGSLHTTQDMPCLNAAERLWKALAAAADLNAGVRPPFVIYNTNAPYCQTTWNTDAEDNFIRAYAEEWGTRELAATKLSASAIKRVFDNE